MMEREAPMHTVQFVISKLDGHGDAGDLSATIVGITGVAHIALDVASRTVSVEYDPKFVSTKMIRGSIEGAGYPVDSVKEFES